MDGQITNTMSDNIKSFWERPEGKVGAVVATGLISGLMYGLYIILPFLITLTTNLILFAGLAIVLFAIVAGAWKSRKLVAVLFKMAMRQLTEFVINLDPVSIIEEHVSELKRKMMKMKEQIGSLNGQKRKLIDEINRNDTEIQEQILLAKKAQEKGQQHLPYTRQAGRLKQSNEQYKIMLANMEHLYKILKKMQDTSQAIIMDYENLVSSKKREREIMMASYSAYKSAMGIMNGDPDQRELFDRAMENIENDISMKAGEIENFIADSEAIIRSIDLKNEIMSDQGLAMLEEWEAKIPSLMATDGSSEEFILPTNNNKKEPVYIKQDSNTRYNDLL